MNVLSAGIIPIYFENGSPRFLLLRSFSYWDFPKGVVEQGEEPLNAAIRELREETALDQVQFRWGHGFCETEPYTSSKRKVARYYLGEVATARVHLRIAPWLGVPEHHEYRWVSFEEAQQLLGTRVKSVLQWGWRKLQEAEAQERSTYGR